MNITLKDNTPVAEAGKGVEFEKRCREIQKLVNKGRCSLIDLLGRTEKKGREDLQIFKYDAEGRLHTGNLIGLFEYRTETSTEMVVIGDRFGPEKVANDSAEGEFLSFFSWVMLESCLYETPLQLLNESRANGEISIFDQILMLQLAAQLERAWKKGKLRLYRTFPRYDCRVRGQLVLPRKIRMSMGLEDGNMAYQVREYSEDNLYNQLFLQVCLTAEKRYPDLMRRLKRGMPGFRMARQALEQQNTGCGRPDIRSLLNGTAKKITNPVYRDYEILRVTAQKVLKRTGHKSCPYAESGAPFVTGVFLDVSKLWEEYLAKVVFQGLPSQPKRPSDPNWKRLSLLEGMLNIKPDFLWEKEKRVLDAKFRPVWGKVLKGGPCKDIQEDVYQVLAYTLGLDYRRGGVIFPVKGGRELPDKKAFRAVNGKEENTFWLIPFFVPQGEDYGAFSEAMGTETEKVCRMIKESFLRNLSYVNTP